LAPTQEVTEQTVLVPGYSQIPRESQPVAPHPASSPVAQAVTQQTAVEVSPAPQYPLWQPASKGHGVPAAPSGGQAPALQKCPCAQGSANEQVVLQVAASAQPKCPAQGCGAPATHVPARQVLEVSIAVAPLQLVVPQFPVG
jgi:hypothetical protein